MSGNDAKYWYVESTRLAREGEFGRAAAAAEKSLQMDPDSAPTLTALAYALRQQCKFEKASEAARRALTLDSEFAPAWFNLGAVQAAQGDRERAVVSYRRALSLDGKFAQAWSNLGNELMAEGDRDSAIDAYHRALDADPGLAPVWSNLASALCEAERLDEAVAACRKALDLDPGFAMAWNNLGSALRQRGEIEGAIAAGRRAVELAPSSAEAWSNLGNALEALQLCDEAISAHERAVKFAPGLPELHFNFGVTLSRCGRPDAAVSSYRRTLAMAPGHAGAHWNLALTLLGEGALREGWEEYEWRWHRKKAHRRRFGFTPWEGRARSPLRLLLWAEQGVGDEIIYASMVPDLAPSSMTITLEADARLAPLFRRSIPDIAVVAREDPPSFHPGLFDCQAPLGSLGRWLRPSFESFPRRAGYLTADARRTEEYRRRLAEMRGDRKLVIGISWESKNEEFGANKSSRLTHWRDVLLLPDVTFVDLQYGNTLAQREEIKHELGVRIEHLDDLDLFNDLDGLAALCSACDLVITVSNVTAHMAGALGCPAWLILPRGRGKIWYWFKNRADSPWYPSLRIFAQKTTGDWREVLKDVSQELARLIAGQL